MWMQNTRKLRSLLSVAWQLLSKTNSNCAKHLGGKELLMQNCSKSVYWSTQPEFFHCQRDYRCCFGEDIQWKRTSQILAELLRRYCFDYAPNGDSTLTQNRDQNNTQHQSAHRLPLKIIKRCQGSTGPSWLRIQTQMQRTSIKAYAPDPVGDCW